MAKTHCKNGHRLTPDNTYVAARGDRQCRTCRREASRRQTERLRASRGIGAPLCWRCGETKGELDRANCEPCRSEEAARQRALTERRRAQGLCSACGELPLETQWFCGPCAHYSRLWHRGYYEDRVASGLCRDCGADRDRDGQFCSDCLERHNNRENERRAEAAQAGICTNCRSRSARPDGRYCEPCREDTAAVYQARRSAGRCAQCGGERESGRFSRCAACREQNARHQRESRRRRGIAPGVKVMGARE